MTINPTDYDVDELRGGLGEASGHRFGGDGRKTETLGGLTTPPGTAPDQILRSNQHRELFLLQSMASDGTLQKPYLTTLPESLAGELVVFEWLEFLLAKAGFKRTFDVLRYYRSIGWLAEDIEDRLQDYLTGLDDLSAGDTTALDRSDHLLSLMYVARLATMVER